MKGRTDKSDVQAEILRILISIRDSFFADLPTGDNYKEKKINKIAAWITLLKSMIRPNADYACFLNEFDNISTSFKDQSPLFEQIRAIIVANTEHYPQGQKEWSEIFPRMDLAEEIADMKWELSQLSNAVEEILPEVKRSFSEKKIEPFVPSLTSSEAMLKSTLSQCFTNINFYLTQRAQETRTGLKKLLSFGHFSAKDYYDKREDWHSFLIFIIKYYQELGSNPNDCKKIGLEAVIINKLTDLAQKYGKGRSQRFSHLLRKLISEIDQGIITKDELLKCLPIEKIKSDKKVYSSQERITTQFKAYGSAGLFFLGPYERRIENAKGEFLSRPALVRLESKICSGFTVKPKSTS